MRVVVSGAWRLGGVRFPAATAELPAWWIELLKQGVIDSSSDDDEEHTDSHHQPTAPTQEPLPVAPAPASADDSGHHQESENAADSGPHYSLEFDGAIATACKADVDTIIELNENPAPISPVHDQPSDVISSDDDVSDDDHSAVEE